MLLLRGLLPVTKRLHRLPLCPLVCWLYLNGRAADAGGVTKNGGLR